MALSIAGLGRRLTEGKHCFSSRDPHFLTIELSCVPLRPIGVDCPLRDIASAPPPLADNGSLDPTVPTILVPDRRPRGRAVAPISLLGFEAREVVEGAAVVAGVMQLTNVTAFANVDSPGLLVDSVKALPQLIMLLLGAVHEDVHVRASTVGSRVPDPNRYPPEAAPSGKVAEVGLQSVEVSRLFFRCRDRARIGLVGHQKVERATKNAASTSVRLFYAATIKMRKFACNLSDI
jgi:hypothetical protein